MAFVQCPRARIERRDSRSDAHAKPIRAEWTEPFARTIDAAKKYVVSSTLDRVDWNAELVRGDLGLEGIDWQTYVDRNHRST